MKETGKSDKIDQIQQVNVAKINLHFFYILFERLAGTFNFVCECRE